MVKRMEIRKYNLEDIALNFFYGSMPKEEDLCDNGYPVFSGYRVVGYSTKYNIENRSLVVVARGVGGTGNVEIAEEKTFLTNLSIAVSIDEKLADIDFLKYYLNVQGLRYLDSGAAQSQITINNLKHHKIFIPSLVNQKQIASILSAYDNLIENNNKRIKILEQMAENLYKEWFVRFRFPGHESTPLENGIPKGWKIEKIKNCVKRLPFGKTYKEAELEKEGSVIVIDQSTEPFIGYHDDVAAHQASANNPIILFGDHSCKFVLMTRNFSLGENIVPFVSYNDEIVNPYYLFFATHKIIETTEYKRHWGEFVNKKILIPSIDLQKEFARMSIPLKLQLEQLLIENQNLIKQRDLLLPRLMSGKLAV